MTAFELFGIVLAGLMTLFAVVCTMLAAEAARQRMVSDAIMHARWSGIMTFTSFVLMVSIMVKCEAICWVAQHKQEQQNNEAVAEQIADSFSVVVATEHVEYTSQAGVKIGWHSYADVRPVSSVCGRGGINSNAN